MFYTLAGEDNRNFTPLGSHQLQSKPLDTAGKK